MAWVAWGITGKVIYSLFFRAIFGSYCVILLINSINALRTFCTGSLKISFIIFLAELFKHVGQVHVRLTANGCTVISFTPALEVWPYQISVNNSEDDLFVVFIFSGAYSCTLSVSIFAPLFGTKELLARTCRVTWDPIPEGSGKTWMLWLSTRRCLCS